MTYGEMKDFVLQLINQYSVAGSRVPLTYNDQADLVARIPALMRDGLIYVVTTARRLRAVADLTDRPVLPTWYPEGSLLTRVEENPMDDGYYLVLVFSLNGNEFSVAVTVYDSEKEMDIRNYEKNEGSPEEYSVHGIPHYIMGNMARNVAIWRNGNVECSIQGFLTVDQLKQMIDSIYA